MPKPKQETRYNDVPPSEIPEVAHLMAVIAKIDKFREDNAPFFQYWEPLTEEYNDALQAAEKAVRAKGVSCGPIVLYQFQTTVDWDMVFQIRGHEQGLAVGGEIATVQKKGGNKPRYLSAVEAGVVPKEESDLTVKTTPKYKTPDPINT